MYNTLRLNDIRRNINEYHMFDMMQVLSDWSEQCVRLGFATGVCVCVFLFTHLYMIVCVCVCVCLFVRNASF